MELTTSTETIRLIRDGERGRGVWRWRKREIIVTYLSLHCHHQNDSCTGRKIDVFVDES